VTPDEEIEAKLAGQKAPMSDLADEPQKKPTADALRSDIEALIERADSINPFNPFSTYYQVRAVNRAKRELFPRLQQLHRQYQRSLGGPVSGGFGLIGPYLTRAAGQGISALLTVERSWRELGAIIDRKSAFSLVYVSLYVAIVALLVAVVSCVLTVCALVGDNLWA